MAMRRQPIRLLVLDIDGVVTDGEAQALDLDLLAVLAALNRAARLDPGRPAVTFCTGRPAPYVEAMVQAVDGHVPAVFESGAGLYVPQPYGFRYHPALQSGVSMEDVRRRLVETLASDGRAFLQAGKEYCLSLFAVDQADTPHLERWAAEALGPLAPQIDLVYARDCLNITPSGIDKGRGLALLAEATGFTFAEMLGVGDSDADLAFLSLAGHSAAPANANARVKAAVQYVAPQATAQGLRDILRHFALLP